MARPGRLFLFRLCRDLGLADPDALGASMSAQLRTEWRAFYELEAEASDRAIHGAQGDR